MGSESYRVFTVANGTVTAGAVIETLSLKGAGIDIPAIIIGQEGRGRARGVVPVGNPPMVPCPERNQEVGTSSEQCPKCGVALGEGAEGYTRNHPDTGMVQGRLMFAEVGKTKAGKPKFLAKERASTTDFVIVVFKTRIGFRGGNSHTGDRVGWQCSKYGCDASGEDAVMPEACPKCGATARWDGPRVRFAMFPGEIIAKGYIAQGAAGQMGNGEQLIALMPKNVVFRTAYSGRLYGAPDSHFYRWDGAELRAATWEERLIAEVF